MSTIKFVYLIDSGDRDRASKLLAALDDHPQIGAKAIESSLPDHWEILVQDPSVAHPDDEAVERVLDETASDWREHLAIAQQNDASNTGETVFYEVTRESGVLFATAHESWAKLVAKEISHRDRGRVDVGSRRPEKSGEWTITVASYRDGEELPETDR